MGIYIQGRVLKQRRESIMIAEIIAELSLRDVTRAYRQQDRRVVLAVEEAGGVVRTWGSWEAAYKALSHDVRIKRAQDKTIIMSVIVNYDAVESVQERLIRRGAELGTVACIVPGKNAEVYYHLPMSELKRDDILAFMHEGQPYCEDCCVAYVFNGDRLSFVETINGDSFVAPGGEPFDLIHEGTVEYEDYAGQIIPIKGVDCSQCNAVLIEAFEQE
jgi:hypothetical protein